MLPNKRRLLSCMIIAPILLGGCFTVTHLLSTGLVHPHHDYNPVVQPTYSSRWPPPEGMMFARRMPATKAQREFAYGTALAQLGSLKSGIYNPSAMAQGRFAPLFFINSDLTYYDYLKRSGPSIRRWRAIQVIEAHTFAEDAGTWLTISIAAPGIKHRGTVLFYAKPLGAQPVPLHGLAQMQPEF